MITKFKIFEKKGDIFNIGDWVLLEGRWNVYPYVKIIDKNSVKTHYSFNILDDYEMPQNDYFVETFSLTEIGVEKTFWVNDYEIDRKLTPDEIEQTKAKIYAIKYNI